MTAAALQSPHSTVPSKTGSIRFTTDLVEVVRCLVELRTELVAGWRDGAKRDELDRCNAILSMIVGGEYPSAGIRRDRVQKARDELCVLLGR